MENQYTPEAVIVRVTGCCASDAIRMAKKLGDKAASLPAMYLESKGPEIRAMIANAGVTEEPAPTVEKARTTRAKKV
jgi:hypothetical protein